MATTAAQDEYNNLFRDKSRRTAHPEDDAASFLDDNSDDESSARTPPANSSPQPTGNYKIPTTRHQSNTGPKGVITDAQAYRDAARSRPSMTASRTSLQQLPEVETPHWNAQEDIDEELEDDEFMQEWRKQRLAAMSGASKVLGGRRRDRSANRTHFGGIVPVDGPGFLDAVDGSGSVTVVVVFIWDDRSEVSDLVEEALAPLAKKYVNTRFVKLHFADAEMEPAGVPAILAYRAGDKFAGMVPVVDEIPDDADLSPETLERVMQRHQML